jgi:PAS domain S-box-containing protein
MSWVTVIWWMSAGACLTLGFLQFIVWWKDRAARANLVFAVGAVAVAIFAGLELALMQAETLAQFSVVMRWIHVPAWVLIVSIVAFVRLYLNAGRRWLAWSVVAVRTLSLILNFVLSPSINFRKLTGLRHVQFLGESVSLPVGVPNPWMLVAQFSLLLLVIFVVDATITVWRRGDRRRALVVGGSVVLLVVLASAQAVAMTWGILATPLTVSLFYLILVAAMAYELSYDLIHAAQVNRQLQANEATLRESEQRFRTVADAAPVLIWMSGVDKLCTFFNKRWLEFTGRSLEQELGNGWAEGVHDEDLQKCLKTYTEAFDARKPFVMQYRLRRNDGEYRWISDHGVSRYDADGVFVGYIGSCVDVTNLITREQALHDINERMDLATKAAGLIVWNWDIPRDEVWLSEKDRALLGFSLSETLTAKRVRSVIYRDDRELVRQLVEKSLKTDEELEGEYRIVLGDGRVRWVTRRGRVEFDGNGDPVCERGVLTDITEAVKNKEALRGFEERVVLAAQAAHLGVWELDIATNELWMSDSALGLFQIDPELPFDEEMLQARLHPEDRAMWRSARNHAIETEGEYAIEYRVLLRDGNVRWLAGRGRCLPAKHGKGNRLVCVSVDITSQKHAQELFRLAAEASHLGVWHWDEASQRISWDRAARNMFGVPADVDITLDTFYGAVHPDDLERVKRARRQALESQQPYQIEYRTQRTDGTICWVHSRGRGDYDELGKPLSMSGVIFDITDRKKAEELFELATEASPNGVVLIDGQGLIILVNSQIENVFGYTRDELIGKPVEILLPERFGTSFENDRANFFVAAEARTMGPHAQLFARRKDGSEVPVEIGVNAVQTAQGLVVLANVVDISARLAAEEVARRSREQVELLSRVSLLGEMTASLAHELNQPLAAIVNNATAAMQYLEQGRLNPEQLQDILNDVVADGRRACDVMHNVRSAIKKGTAIRGRINLNDLVKAITHTVQPDAAANRCIIRTAFAGNLPPIEGDPIQIQQAVINLVRNAFDAMRDAPPSRRTVEITTDYDGEGAIDVAVRDYGSGISEAIRERLFEQFFTTKDEGLGMGLAIVRSIAESHGGTISVENAQGGGARFHFRLPITEEVPR